MCVTLHRLIIVNWMSQWVGYDIRLIITVSWVEIKLDVKINHKDRSCHDLFFSSLSSSFSFPSSWRRREIVPVLSPLCIPTGIFVYSALTGFLSCITSASNISSSSSSLAFNCSLASFIARSSLGTESFFLNTSYPLSFLQWSTFSLLGILGSSSQSLP